MGSRSFSELSSSGLLWLINRVVFHPRGYALEFDTDEDGNATGWRLFGNGTEPWSFPAENEARKFQAVQATFADPSARVRASIKDIAEPLDFSAPLGFDLQILPDEGGSTIRFAVNHTIHAEGKEPVPPPRGIRSHGIVSSPESLVTVLLRDVQYAYTGSNAYQAPEDKEAEHG